MDALFSIAVPHRRAAVEAGGAVGGLLGDNPHEALLLGLAGGLSSGGVLLLGLLAEAWWGEE